MHQPTNRSEREKEPEMTINLPQFNMSPRERQVDQLAKHSGSSCSLGSLASEESRKAKQQQRRLSFGFVEVREYQRMVGDHPEVKFGPPMTLSWEFEEKPKQTLNEYELRRPSKRINFHLSGVARRKLLRDVFGATDEEIDQAIKDVQSTRKKRENSLNQPKAVARIDSAVRSAKRKFLRRLSPEVLMNGLSNVAGSMIPLGVAM